MKLRNKKTGEVFNFVIKAETDPTESHFKLRTGSGGWEDGLVYGSLEELNEEWEDYEESDLERGGERWYVDSAGDIGNTVCLFSNDTIKLAEIGNSFRTKKEAEKAVEKLKAWKRLKDKGFKFDSYHIPAGEIYFDMEIPKGSLDEIAKDLTLLFGGEGEDES